MKKLLSLLLSMSIFAVSLLPAGLAASAVPQAVIKSAASVVLIRADYRFEYAAGSGFVISNDGSELLIATNNHVIEDTPKKITVYSDDIPGLEAEVVFKTEEYDTAVLRLRGSYNLAPLEFGQAEWGDVIYAIGFPAAAEGLSDRELFISSDATITDGIVSALRKVSAVPGGPVMPLYQISAPITHGNSGGPLFNEQGLVVGINTYGTDVAGISGAIDISVLCQLLGEHNIRLHGPKSEAEIPKLSSAEEARVMYASALELYESGSCFEAFQSFAFLAACSYADSSERLAEAAEQLQGSQAVKALELLTEYRSESTDTLAAAENLLLVRLRDQALERYRSGYYSTAARYLGPVYSACRRDDDLKLLTLCNILAGKEDSLDLSCFENDLDFMDARRIILSASAPALSFLNGIWCDKNGNSVLTVDSDTLTLDDSGICILGRSAVHNVENGTVYAGGNKDADFTIKRILSWRLIEVYSHAQNTAFILTRR